MNEKLTIDFDGDADPEDGELSKEKLFKKNLAVLAGIEPYLHSQMVGYKPLSKLVYDEDGDHLKTLMVKKYENISGFWIITHSQMNNIQKKHTTDMQLSKVKVNGGIANRQFTERMMRRGVR